MIKTTFSVTTVFFLFANLALANESIRIAGSSTVYPFVTVVAEDFSRKTDYSAPTVEAIGTGGGFILFCAATGKASIDIVNASRQIKQSEIDLCKKNSMGQITEIQIGYDGVVFANSNKSSKFNLSKEQIFKAVAKQIPLDGNLVNNPYKKWSDIGKDLPNKKIEIYGPPPTSGTRDAIAESLMEDVCMQINEFKDSYKNETDRKIACHMIREDGAYIESGENDNLIVQKIIANQNAVGIFGYSFLAQNSSEVQSLTVDNVEPNFANISKGDYPLTRPLFVYIKDSLVKSKKNLAAFVRALISSDVLGENGYLIDKGLIPVKTEELKLTQEKINKLL